MKWYSIVHENGSAPLDLKSTQLLDNLLAEQSTKDTQPGSGNLETSATLDNHIQTTLPSRSVNPLPGTLTKQCEMQLGPFGLLKDGFQELNLQPASRDTVEAGGQNGVGNGKSCNYKHTHVAFETDKKMHFRDARKFDFCSLHPNIKVLQTQQHVERVWKYHEKAPVLLTRSERSPVRPTNMFQQIINAPNLTEAIKIANVEIKTVADVRALRADQQTTQVIPPLLNACSFDLQAPEGFRVIFITGPTGCGKTRWALTQFDSPLLVSHLEDLKGFKQDLHDGIVFDDMSFSQMAPNVAIHLLDWELPRTLNVKFGSITLPAQTRKIFTSNESFETVFPQCTPAVMAALMRRTHIIQATGPLFLHQAPLRRSASVNQNWWNEQIPEPEAIDDMPCPWEDLL